MLLIKKLHLAFVKLAACYVVCLLVTGCAQGPTKRVKTSSEYDPTKSYVAVSVAPNREQDFVYHVLDVSNGKKFRFLPGPNAYSLKNKGVGPYKTHVPNFIKVPNSQLHVLEIPPGDYIIYGWSFTISNQFYSVTHEGDLNLSFSVPDKQSVYLGTLYNDLKLGVFFSRRDGRVSVIDNFERDIKALKQGFENFSDVSFKNISKPKQY